MTIHERDQNLIHDEISLFTWEWQRLTEAYATEDDELFTSRLYDLLESSAIYYSTKPICHPPMLSIDGLRAIGVKTGL